jgi:hypothetical protein
MSSETDPHPLPTLPKSDPRTPAPLRRVPVPESETPPSWIVIGPRLRAQLGPQLERAMPLVWLALMEMSGAQEGQGFRLVIDGAHLEPAPD